MAATIVFRNLAAKLRSHKQFGRLVHFNRHSFIEGCTCSSISSKNSKQKQRLFHRGTVSSFDCCDFPVSHRRTVTATLCYVQNIRYSPWPTYYTNGLNSSTATGVRMEPCSLNLCASIADIPPDQCTNFVLAKDCCGKTYEYEQWHKSAPQATACCHASRRRHNFKFIGKHSMSNGEEIIVHD